jgi:group I intron endonuclease
MRQSGIYSIKHIASGRIYVGSAINLRMRWHQHKSDLRLGKHHSRYLQRAWNKHGADAFVFTIIEIVADPKTLIEREQYWIDEFKAATSNNGFNLSPTAGSALGIKRTEEFREKCRQRRHTPETRAKMIGHIPPLMTDALRAIRKINSTGRKHSAATIAKLKNASPDLREIRRKNVTGRKHSEAAIAKMRNPSDDLRATRRLNTLRRYHFFAVPEQPDLLAALLVDDS